MGLLKHIGIFVLFGLDWLFEKIMDLYGYILGVAIVFSLYMISKGYKF